MENLNKIYDLSTYEGQAKYFRETKNNEELIELLISERKQYQILLGEFITFKKEVNEMIRGVAGVLSNHSL